MINAGIEEGDILVVDSAQSVDNGKIFIAELDGYFAIKRVVRKKEKGSLAP